MKEKQKRVLLNVDDESYNIAKNEADKIISNIHEVIDECNSVGVKIEDLSTFFEDAMQYIQDKYFEQNKKLLPVGINKEIALNQTSFKTEYVRQLLQEITNYLKVKSNVQINKSNVKNITDKEQWSSYLVESKRKEYELLQKLILIATELHDIGGNTVGNLSGAARTSFQLFVQGERLQIRPYYFSIE